MAIIMARTTTARTAMTVGLEKSIGIAVSSQWQVCRSGGPVS
jgi:hypothetical protein